MASDLASDARYCPRCGGKLSLISTVTGLAPRPTCVDCGAVHYQGPALSVLALVFAEDRILLIRRGLPPYVGRWAPPGGYVEADESLEAAAVREVAEEVSVEIDRHKMIPHAILSLPAIRQVCVCFIAMLERMVPLKPVPPEVTEARWFLQSEYPITDVWGPSENFDIGLVFDRVRSGRFDFYQQTDDALRVIREATQISYIWRRDEP